MNLDSHREAAFWEDLEFLRDCGLSDAAIAKRLNINLKTLQRREDRQ